MSVLNQFQLLECNEIQTIKNAKTPEIYNPNKRGEVYLNGTELKYTCNADFVSNVSKLTCDENGEWKPTFQCYPGFLFHCFTYSSSF